MEEPLKFCMVTTFYPPYHFGGDAVFVHRLSNELARRGYEVDVIHCRDSHLFLRNGGSQGKYPNHPGVRVYGLRNRAGFLSPLLTHQTGLSVFKRRALKGLLEKNDYDVIHYHNMSLIGAAALQYGDAVKLYTTHEFWLVCPMHVLWKFNRKPCDRKTCLPCTLAGKRPPQLWRYTGLLNRMLPHVDAFISPSRFAKAKHLELGFPMPMTHIPLFLPNSGEIAERPQPRNPLSGDRPNFLFVGRLEKIKGLQDLIPVFKRHPEYALLIAGEGPYGKTLRKSAGHSSNIKFLGRLDFDRLRKLYAQSVAVIVPSLCFEISPLTILESFSSKTPVIVRDIGAMPEIIRDSGGGVVYNHEGELYHGMKTLAEHPELRNELGNNGYRAYRRLWTADSHLEKYFGLIRAIQKRRRGIGRRSASSR